MNAKQMNRIFARTMYGMVIVAMVFSATGIVYAQEESPPPPHIEAFAWLDRIQLFDWPSDVTVALSISNPNIGSTGVTVDSQGFAEFYPEGDLQPGSIITAVYAETTKVLEISPLNATVDPTTGVVNGVATPNSTFHMRTDGDHFQLPIEQDIDSGSTGTWSVTINQYLPWTWFTRGEMWEGDDDGDVTYAIWHVQQPVVEVWLTQNEIRAFGWPRETDLDFYVNNEYLGTATTQPMNWYEGTWAVLYAWDYDFQLEPGMEVTVTGDGLPQKSTIIQDLKITYIDIDNDVVYGYAPPNADLELASWEDSPPIRFFNNGADPKWMVDYKEPSLNGVTVDLNPDDDIRLFMRDEEKDSTVWESFASFPHFTIYPEWEAVEAWGWPEGVEITANLNGILDCNAYGTPEYPDWDLSTTNVWMNFPEGCDVTAGNNVILSAEGVPDVSHVVQNLSITEVNAENDTVTGMADSGVVVYVWPHGFGEYEVQPAAGVDNVWVADFSGFGDVLQPGMDGRSEVRDDFGNATAVDWHAPKPRITVYPVWNAVEAWDWPDGVLVTAVVSGNDENCTTDGYPVADPWGTNVWMNFPETCDVTTDDVVTLTADGVIPVSHTVRNLSVTEVNADAETVSGTADEGEMVYVWPHSFGEYEVQPTADGGIWLADFSGYGDILQPGTDGRSEVRDDYGNSTAVDWHTPNTRFTVWPEWNYLEGYEWPDGALVSVSVDGKDNCGTYAVSGYPEEDPSNTFFSLTFPEGCVIEAGDFITLNFESLNLTHQVQELAISDVSLVSDTVVGTAFFDPEQYDLHTWVHGVDGSYMQLTVDGVDWLSDFNSLGIDLQAGMGGRVELTDQASNSTAVEWWIPSPWFSAFPEGEIIEGWDWPMDADIHLTIEDPDTEDSPDFEMNGKMVPTPWDPESGATWVWFEFPDVYDLKPGDIVTLTDGITERTHVVQNLDITEINLDENQVYGTADAEKNVTLWSWEDPEGRRIETTSDGNWGVDFDDIGFTLEPGYHVRAEVWIDGNNTAVDRYITNPRFTVFPEWEWFDGNDWPDGALVSITVADKDGNSKPECTTEKESWDYFFNGNFGDGCDVVIGDTVTFADGETVRTHTVQNLSVTKVEPGNDVVKGTADAGAEVHVWPHATGQEQLVITNPKGKWNVSFAGIYDLMPGDGGRAEIRDDVGNSTAVDWYIPNPRIVASITEDWFFLQEFNPNTILNFTLYRALGEKPIWKGTATTDGSGFAWVDPEGRWDLEPGNYLVVKDGSNSKDLVIEGFTFDVFDVSHGILQGTVPGQEGRHVWAGIGFENDGWSMDVNTDETGAWIADFGGPVPGDYQWVAAQIFDDDGDATELRPASQIIYLRPSCGTTYTVQANAQLEIGYGGWLAIGEGQASQNAEHLTVNLVIDGELVLGVQQPVVPGSEIPCGALPEDAYGVYYVTHLEPFDTGEHAVTVTWSFDEQVTDGYDSDGDGQLDLYGPGEVATQEFTIFVP